MIGELKGEMLEAVLETLPLEFSVVDADDRVVAWNKHETRIFRRPLGVVGKTVQACHPPKSMHKVQQILSGMQEGKIDKARFWIDLGIGPDGAKEKVMIEYYALRSADGRYLGCLESSQSISELRALEGEKRLLG